MATQVRRSSRNGFADRQRQGRRHGGLWRRRQEDRFGATGHARQDQRQGFLRGRVVRRILGMGEDYYPLPWPNLKYDTNLGGYRVGITEESAQGRAEVQPQYRLGLVRTERDDR